MHGDRQAELSGRLHVVVCERALKQKNRLLPAQFSKTNRFVEVEERNSVSGFETTVDAFDSVSVRVRLHNGPYLKMNSGMNRLGFTAENYRAAWERASASEAIGSITLMAHFGNADEGSVDWQLERFDNATRDIPGERSISNSAAALWHLQAHRDWVRPGIVLYGASPSGQSKDIKDIELRASMTLQSELIGVQTMRAGETVGYARTYRAESEMRIGVVACGYADGYPRHAPTGTPISDDGVITRTVGRVSMDMLTVDLTPCPNAGVGSNVELWGELVKIDDVASSSGTIGYELMCALARRVPGSVSP